MGWLQNIDIIMGWLQNIDIIMGWLQNIDIIMKGLQVYRSCTDMTDGYLYSEGIRSFWKTRIIPPSAFFIAVVVIKGKIKLLSLLKRGNTFKLIATRYRNSTIVVRQNIRYPLEILLYVFYFRELRGGPGELRCEAKYSKPSLINTSKVDNGWGRQYLLGVEGLSNHVLKNLSSEVLLGFHVFYLF